jgi:hypothetical protein
MFVERVGVILSSHSFFAFKKFSYIHLIYIYKLLNIGKGMLLSFKCYERMDIMKTYIILFLLMLLIGCAAPQVNLVDPMGRILPNPHYVLISTGELQLQTLFYWSKVNYEKDLDGKYVHQSKYLYLHDLQTLNLYDAKSVVITLEVSNPKRISYEVIQNMKVVGTERGHVSYIADSVGKSNMPYRRFTVDLPFDKKTRNVQCGLRLVNCADHSEIMRIEKFSYTITHGRR